MRQQHEGQASWRSPTLPGRPPKRVVRTEGLVVMASPEALRDLPIEVEVFGSVQEWVHRKLAGGLAHSTKTSYSESWAKWLWWCNRRGISPPC